MFQKMFSCNNVPILSIKYIFHILWVIHECRTLAIKHKMHMFINKRRAEIMNEKHTVVTEDVGGHLYIVLQQRDTLYGNI